MQHEESAHTKVIARLEQRRNIGMQTYGVPLLPHNGRDNLEDALEEVLDLACYLQNRISEEDLEPTELW